MGKQDFELMALRLVHMMVQKLDRKLVQERVIKLENWREI